MKIHKLMERHLFDQEPSLYSIFSLRARSHKI